MQALVQAAPLGGDDDALAAPVGGVLLARAEASLDEAVDRPAHRGKREAEVSADRPEEQRLLRLGQELRRLDLRERELEVVDRSEEVAPAVGQEVLHQVADALRQLLRFRLLLRRSRCLHACKYIRALGP